jgi:hypothetical protein
MPLGAALVMRPLKSNFQNVFSALMRLNYADEFWPLRAILEMIFGPILDQFCFLKERP